MVYSRRQRDDGLQYPPPADFANRKHSAPETSPHLHISTIANGFSDLGGGGQQLPKL